MKFTKLKIYLLPALLAAAWFGPRKVIDIIIKLIKICIV